MIDVVCGLFAIGPTLAEWEVDFTCILVDAKYF